MRLTVNTKVKGNYKFVMSKFDESLFTKLNPPFPPVKLKRFDGSKKDDQVILELNFIFFKQNWESLIIYDEITENHALFIDEGIKLPFFLKYWQHHHYVINDDESQSIIKDQITYRTWNKITDWLLIPVFYLQFLYRRPIYKKYFD